MEVKSASCQTFSSYTERNWHTRPRKCLTAWLFISPAIFLTSLTSIYIIITHYLAQCACVGGCRIWPIVKYSYSQKFSGSSFYTMRMNRSSWVCMNLKSICVYGCIIFVICILCLFISCVYVCVFYTMVMFIFHVLARDKSFGWPDLYGNFLSDRFFLFLRQNFSSSQIIRIW